MGRGRPIIYRVVASKREPVAFLGPRARTPCVPEEGPRSFVPPAHFARLEASPPISCFLVRAVDVPAQLRLEIRDLYTGCPGKDMGVARSLIRAREELSTDRLLRETAAQSHPWRKTRIPDLLMVLLPQWVNGLLLSPSTDSSSFEKICKRCPNKTGLFF